MLLDLVVHFQESLFKVVVLLLMKLNIIHQILVNRFLLLLQFFEFFKLVLYLGFLLLDLLLLLFNNLLFFFLLLFLLLDGLPLNTNDLIFFLLLGLKVFLFGLLFQFEQAQSLFTFLFLFREKRFLMLNLLSNLIDLLSLFQRVVTLFLNIGFDHSFRV